MTKSSKIRRRLLLLRIAMWIWVMPITLVAQTQNVIEPTYLSLVDGLASSVVIDVMQDSYGLIWISTTNGIQKYDGNTFQTFKNDPGNPKSLQNNSVWGLLEDKDHNIWMGTDMGPTKYDRKKNEFINYPLAEHFNFPPGSPILIFSLFLDSQGSLWAGTRDLEFITYDPEKDVWKSPVYTISGIDSLAMHGGICMRVAEDGKGGIWAGSGGYGLLHRAKGERGFKQVPLKGIKLNDPNNGSLVTALFFDKENILWFTTRRGVYKYNPETEDLRVIKEYETILNETTATFINDIFIDGSGNVWIANNRRGMLKFEGTTDNYQEVSISGKEKSVNGGWDLTLSSAMIDNSGIFWFGSFENGVLKYDPVNKPFTNFVHEDQNPLSLNLNKGVYGVQASKAKSGLIYVGTRGGGLNIFDPVNQTFQKVTVKVEEDRFGGSVRSVAETNDGSLWLGTWGDGLVRLDQSYNEVARYKAQPEPSNAISSNLVRVIKPDGKGKLWLGTDNGLNILNIQTGAFERIYSKDTRVYSKELRREVKKLMTSERIVGIIDQVKEMQNKSLEVNIKESGTYLVVTGGEATAQSPADFGWIENSKKDTVWLTKTFTESYHAGGAIKNRIKFETIKLNPGVYTLRYRSDDSHNFGGFNEAPPDQIALWGIALLKLQEGSEVDAINKLLLPDENQLLFNGSNVSDIEITDKYIWISAAANGLSRIDRSTNRVEYFQHDPKNLQSINSNNVNDIYADSQGTIWLTSERGIGKFDSTAQFVTRYSEADGLPTNFTIGILEGNNREMWIATLNGLSQMITNKAIRKVTFLNYNTTDGLISENFMTLAAAKGTDGHLYFGSDKGLTMFRGVASNDTPPTVIISKMLISNKSVSDLGENSPLKGTLLDAEDIDLTFDQNNLSFEFAALHYSNPKKNLYAHKLKGYDKDWIYDNRNYVAYTNLDPGEYDFKVRAANAYGIWNEEGKTLHISISPPWYKTTWAYLSYVLLFGLGIYAGDKAIRSSIKSRERELSREKELEQAKEIEKAYKNLKQTQVQLVQAEKMASLGELTAGIAHEIQNPLNFVNNFSEINKELIDEMNQELAAGNLSEVKNIAKNISDNEEKIIFHGRRADGIVKGMLQHSRSSSGVKEMSDINAIADEYLRLAYHGLRAKDKSFNASMKTEFDPQVGKINAVPQDIGRVVLNLITNAFYVVTEKKTITAANGSAGDKYEPTVTVSTKKNGNKVEIRVSDNGSGIPQSVLDKIFQPFFTTKPSGQGTGLGLSMSYEIITKGHGGELKVETQVGQGTTFIIVLPN
ncbi:MAG: two-component regulator propeller domain-containing protein [Chryseolinea sp.]